jgi:hypothetical protein
MKPEPEAPHLAGWLLTNFVRGYHGESLAGDLLEELHRGRSRLWYWNQVLRAIASNVRGVLFHQAPLLGRSVAIAWVVLALTGWGGEHVYLLWRQYWDAHVTLFLRWNVLALHPMVASLPAIPIIVSTHAIAGLVARRIAGPRCTLGFWFFLLTVIAWRTPWIVRLAQDSLYASRYLPYLTASIVECVMAALGVVVGAGVIRRPHFRHVDGSGGPVRT